MESSHGPTLLLLTGLIRVVNLRPSEPQVGARPILIDELVDERLMVLFERVLRATSSTLHLLHHALILSVRSELVRSQLVPRRQHSERVGSLGAQRLIGMAHEGCAKLTVAGRLEDTLMHQRHLSAVIVCNGQVLRTHVVDVRRVNVYDDLSRHREELWVALSLIDQVQR